MDRETGSEAFTGKGILKWPFRVEPRVPGGSVQGEIFEGVANLTFRPATLRFGTLRPGFQDLSDPAPAGSLTFQLSGLLPGALRYVRRFSLAGGRSVALDISFFEDCALSVIGGSLPGFQVAGYVDNAVINNGSSEYLVLSERYGAAGTRYLVPAGASRCFPALNDAAFQWANMPIAGALVTIAEALTAGTATDPKGTIFIPGVPGLALTWRIEL